MSNFKNDIEVLKCWIGKKGIDLYSDKKTEGEYNPHHGYIKYNTSYSFENQLYELLHECGHYLIDKNSMKKGNFVYHKQVEALEDYRKERSYVYRMEVIREEFDAWERGWRLSKRLNLSSANINNYKKQMSRYIGTYFEWFCNRDWSDGLESAG